MTRLQRLLDQYNAELVSAFLEYPEFPSPIDDGIFWYDEPL